MNFWEHPALGKFCYEEYLGWKQRIHLEAFDIFQYDSHLWPDRKADLILKAWEVEEIPTDAMVTMAASCVTNISTLLAEGIDYLYNDFHGTGPDSGMWWCGAKDQVDDILEAEYSRNMLSKKEGLFELLGKPFILVQEFGMSYPHHCAIIGFESPIETSHGIGFLTNGENIIGIGYNTDTSPFGK